MNLPPIRYFPEIERGYIEISKNASSSLRTAFVAKGMHGTKVNRDGALGLDLVAFWRDPHERAVSLYQMWAKRNGYGLSHLPFSEWLLIWINNPPFAEKCVLPQSDYCITSMGKWLPTHIVRWDFREMASMFGLCAIPVENASLPLSVQWSIEALNAFSGRYWLDIEIWNGLGKNAE